MVSKTSLPAFIGFLNRNYIYSLEVTCDQQDESPSRYRLSRRSYIYSLEVVCGQQDESLSRYKLPRPKLHLQFKSDVWSATRVSQPL